MKKLLGWAVFCAVVLLPQKVDAATVVQTCGTLPQPYTVGSTRPVTVDTNGQVCS